MRIGDRIIVLYTGTPESIETVQELVDSGFHIHPLVCDNGCMYNINEVVDSLQIFDSNLVELPISQSIAGPMQDMSQAIEILWEQRHICIYPEYVDYLACHSIAVAFAIKWAKMLGIRYVSCVMPSNDRCVLGMLHVTSKYAHIANTHSIHLLHKTKKMSQSMCDRCMAECIRSGLTNEGLHHLLQVFDCSIYEFMSMIVDDVPYIRFDANRLYVTS